MMFIKMWLYPSLIGVMCLSLPLPYPNPEILPTPERLANGRYSQSNVSYVPMLCDLKSSHFSCTFGLQIRDCWNIAVQLKKFVRKIRFEKGKQKNSLLRIKMGTPFVWNWKEKKPQKPQNQIHLKHFCQFFHIFLFDGAIKIGII